MEHQALQRPAPARPRGGELPKRTLRPRTGRTVLRDVGAVIVAAGRGLRMRARGLPLKQYRLLGGRPVFWWSLHLFEQVPSVGEIVLVLPPDDVEWVRERWLSDWPGVKPLALVAGGASRQESVSRGRQALSPACRWIAVHDGVRPLCTPELVERVIAGARETGAAIAALPLVHTLKQVNEAGEVVQTLPRENLWIVQTPQVFRRDLLEQAHADGAALDQVTDDAALLERMGVRVRVVPGEETNMKITYDGDLAVAQALLGVVHPRTLDTHRAEDASRRVQRVSGELPVRMGYGFDVHRLEPGYSLILGGVRIPYEKGLVGHSDADVLTHAVMDALLGAAGLGDIGRHFPDTDEAYRGADSMDLLQRVVALLAQRGWVVGQVHATVVAKRPKLAPYIPQMRARLAQRLGVSVEAVNVKATTSEGLGFTGRGEGIAAHAVATVIRGGVGV